MLLVLMLMLFMLTKIFVGNSCDKVSGGPALFLLLSLVLFQYCSAEVFQYLLTGIVFQYFQNCCNKIIFQPQLAC